MTTTTAKQAADAVAKQFQAIADQVTFVIGIDPSSTCTGLALARIGPDDTSDAILEAVRVHHSTGGDPTPRIRQMLADIREWITAPDRPRDPQTGRLAPTFAIVVEIPTGERSTKTKRKTGGKGLTTYARAVGRVEALVEELAHSPDHAVLTTERHWTGSIKKESRTAVIRAIVPTYDPEQDPGQDVADAIGLALWGCRQLRQGEQPW